MLRGLSGVVNRMPLRVVECLLNRQPRW